MTLSKHKGDVNLNFHSTNKFDFWPYTKEHFLSVSNGHCSASSRAFLGFDFEKGVAPLILT